MPGPDAYRRRLVGLYALTQMERRGPLHGYGLSEAIAERTDGQWRPGPGAVYPSLRKLVEAHLARSRRAGRRTEYAITPGGRLLLARLRNRRDRIARGRADLSALWAEVMGTTDVGAFLIDRLHRTVDAIEDRLERGELPPGEERTLREGALRELQRSVERLETRLLAAGGRGRAPTIHAR